MKKLTPPLLLFTTALVAIIALLKYTVAPSYIHETVWAIILFVFALTLASLLLGQRGGHQSPEAFVKYVMGGTVIRFTLSILAVYVALKMEVPNRVVFVVNFMLAYFVFLTFELYSLLTTLRANFEKPT